MRVPRSRDVRDCPCGYGCHRSRNSTPAGSTRVADRGRPTRSLPTACGVASHAGRAGTPTVAACSAPRDRRGWALTSSTRAGLRARNAGQTDTIGRALPFPGAALSGAWLRREQVERPSVRPRSEAVGGVDHADVQGGQAQAGIGALGVVDPDVVRAAGPGGGGVVEIGAADMMGRSSGRPGWAVRKPRSAATVNAAAGIESVMRWAGSSRRRRVGVPRRRLASRSWLVERRSPRPSAGARGRRRRPRRAGTAAGP